MINRYEFDSYRDRHEFRQLLRSHGSALRRRESCHLDVSAPVFSLEDMMMWTYNTKRTFCEVTGLQGLMAKVLNEAGSWECGICQGQIIRRSIEQQFEFLRRIVSSLGASSEGMPPLDRVKLLFSGGFSGGARNDDAAGSPISTSRSLAGGDLSYFMRYAMGHGVRRIIMDGVLSKVTELSEELEDGALKAIDEHGVQKSLKGLPHHGAWEVVVDSCVYDKFSVARMQEAFARVRQLGCDVLYVRHNMAGDILPESIRSAEWGGELLGSYAENPYCESCGRVFPELEEDGALRQLEQSLIRVMDKNSEGNIECATGKVGARYSCVMPCLAEGEVLSVKDLGSDTVEELSLYFTKLSRENAANRVIRPVASVLRHRFYVLKQLGLGHINLKAPVASLSRSERWRVVLGIVWSLRLRRGKMLVEEPLHYVSMEEMGFFEACLKKFDERGWSLSVLSQKAERGCNQSEDMCITEVAKLDRACQESRALGALSSPSDTEVDDGINQLVRNYSATYNERQSLALLRVCRIVGMDAAIELRNRVKRLQTRQSKLLSTEAERRCARVIALLKGVLAKEPSRAMLFEQLEASLSRFNAHDCPVLCVEHLMGMGISNKRWQSFLGMLVKLGLSDFNLAGELKSFAIEDWQLFCLARALCFTPGQKGIIIFDRLDCGWSPEVRQRVFHAMKSHTSRGGVFILKSTCPEQQSWCAGKVLQNI